MKNSPSHYLLLHNCRIKSILLKKTTTALFNLFMVIVALVNLTFLDVPSKCQMRFPKWQKKENVSFPFKNIREWIFQIRKINIPLQKAIQESSKLLFQEKGMWLLTKYECDKINTKSTFVTILLWFLLPKCIILIIRGEKPAGNAVIRVDQVFIHDANVIKLNNCGRWFIIEWNKFLNHKPSNTILAYWYYQRCSTYHRKYPNC